MITGMVGQTISGIPGQTITEMVGQRCPEYSITEVCRVFTCHVPLIVVNFAHHKYSDVMIENVENADRIIFRCTGAICKKKKGHLLESYIKKYNREQKMEVERMGCSNRCTMAPVFHLHTSDIWFSERDMGTIFKKYILNKQL